MSKEYKLTVVSIHTPTQGVTFKNVIYYNHTNVSIHTPTQGVTWKNWIKILCLKFQSTHPRRV